MDDVPTETPVTPTRTGVQSIERAFAVLELVAASGGAVTLSALAREADLPPATLHRLAATLVDLGYLRQEASRRYALGARLALLADRSSAGLSATALPHLAHLVDAIGETSNLAVLDGDQVAYVAQVPGRHSMRMFTEVGRRVQPHCTAVGKALLAATRTDDEVRALLRRTGLPRHTPHTVVDADDLLEQIAQVRSRGYALDEGEQEVGVRCVAVHVTGAQLPLALSVSGPAPRMTDELIADAFPVLRETATRLGAELA
jgi:IclR family acetate operon transcriptional repressor